MYKYVISKRSKLKNFAPKISSCAQLIVLSIRNANIVFGGTAEELGIRTDYMLPATLCFDRFSPLMGACCAQIKGFTSGCRELVLVRPDVKPFI